jgi:hypothetical protein
MIAGDLPALTRYGSFTDKARRRFTAGSSAMYLSMDSSPQSWRQPARTPPPTVAADAQHLRAGFSSLKTADHRNLAGRMRV